MIRLAARMHLVKVERRAAVRTTGRGHGHRSALPGAPAYHMLNWERCCSLVMSLKPGLRSRHMSFHPPPCAVGPLQLAIDRLAST